MNFSSELMLDDIFCGESSVVQTPLRKRREQTKSRANIEPEAEFDYTQQ